MSRYHSCRTPLRERNHRYLVRVYEECVCLHPGCIVVSSERTRGTVLDESNYTQIPPIKSKWSLRIELRHKPRAIYTLFACRYCIEVEWKENTAARAQPSNKLKDQQICMSK